MRFRAQENPVDGLGSRRIRKGMQLDVDGSFRALQDQVFERAAGAGDDIVLAGGAQRPGNAATDATESNDRDGLRPWKNSFAEDGGPTSAVRSRQGLRADPGTQARIACSSGPTPMTPITRLML